MFVPFKMEPGVTYSVNCLAGGGGGFKPEKLGLCYLASCYTHDDDAELERRYQAAFNKTVELMKQGYVVFSPIVYSHQLGIALGKSRDGMFWKTHDKPYLEACDRLMVLVIPGWDKSTGVAHEIRRAVERGIPIEYVAP